MSLVHSSVIHLETHTVSVWFFFKCYICMLYSAVSAVCHVCGTMVCLKVVLWLAEEWSPLMKDKNKLTKEQHLRMPTIPQVSPSHLFFFFFSEELQEIKASLTPQSLGPENYRGIHCSTMCPYVRAEVLNSPSWCCSILHVEHIKN